MIRVHKITTRKDLEESFTIRRIVFIEEQQVPEREEFDQYEDSSAHFLAVFDQVPCGAARWRITGEGYKLERFAVLKEYRGKGIATALVRAVIEDIRHQGGHNLYLNAQTEAIPLYEKQGFQQVGETFVECDIQHKRMELVI